MQKALLATKLYIPPTRSEFVSRPHLIEQLNAGLHRKLSLISAPAGFGKTTLVTEWVTSCEQPAAWLSLDGGDNDKTRFLTYLVTALQTIDPMIGKGVLPQLQSPQPPPIEPILTDLLNDITGIEDNFILILDDHHVIDAEPVNEVLTFLIEHLPPQMHLVIATRNDPQLPLARLRARSQLTELRAMDLRFSTSEAAEFLNQVMGLDLSAADITALEARTEGWITGLQLAAISMQGRQDTTAFIEAFTGSHRYVLDYLIEEVLDQQSEDIRSFLLQTAVLDRLEGSLCDALTGQDDGSKTLENLDRVNLFLIPLDNERRWYRYHHLFGDLLRERLRQTHSDLEETLHDRASEWHEQNGFVDEAIEHALHAEDFERTAYLIVEYFYVMYQQGAHTKLRHWLAMLPVELVFSKPHLCIIHAWSLFTGGQQDAAEKSLQAAEKVLYTSNNLTTEETSKEQKQLSASDRMKIQGRAAALRAFLTFYHGDIPGTIQYAGQALECLPEQDLPWRAAAAIALGDAYSIKGDMSETYQARVEALKACKTTGDIYLILIANLKRAATLRMQGQLRGVIEICQQQKRLAYENGLSQTVVIGWLLAIWGEVLAEINDLDGALHQAKKGIELTERSNEVVMIGWSYLCLIRVLFTRGDTLRAEGLIKKMENITRECHVPPWITNQVAAWQARIWLAQDRLDAASQWVDERELEAEETLSYLRELEYIMLARILIVQERPGEASALLQRLLEVAEAGERTSRVIEILSLQALAQQVAGETVQAITSLARALTLAEPEGFIRIFVDEGPPMAQLLYEALTHEIAPDYVRQLLAAFPVTEPEHKGQASSQALDSAWVEPLSEREVEVLQLIAEGLTNSEIGVKLFLSAHTIKAHTRNIYSKLDVNNRTQAVTRARSLGILPLG